MRYYAGKWRMGNFIAPVIITSIKDDDGEPIENLLMFHATFAPMLAEECIACYASD